MCVCVLCELVSLWKVNWNVKNSIGGDRWISEKPNIQIINTNLRNKKNLFFFHNAISVKPVRGKEVPLPFSLMMIFHAMELCRGQQCPRDNHRNGKHLRQALMMCTSQRLTSNPLNPFGIYVDLIHPPPMRLRSFLPTVIPSASLDAMNYKMSFLNDFLVTFFHNLTTHK